MNERNDLTDPNTPLVEIYDDVLKFYIAQGFLDKIAGSVRYIYTGKNWKEKLINYATPFAKFLRRHFEYQKRYQPHFIKENLEDKVWLFISSLNNRNSLKFLLKELDDTILVGTGVAIQSSDKYQIPFHRTVLHIWKFPKIWYFFKKKYGEAAIKYSDLIFRSIGLYEIVYDVLVKYRPKCIVVANDHSEKQRALLNAAKRLNIPIIYIQHASISDFMPPLDFDLSLLEGQAALDKYKQLGKVKGKVQLIGMPKFDNYIQFRNHSTTVRNIGICTNMLDKVLDIYNIINTIQQKFPQIKISLRPHPGYKMKLTPPENVRLSTKDENIFDFLKEQDLLIAGSSSVHLEALLLNVTSIYFQISAVTKHSNDPYGYVENRLLPEAQNIEELTKIIEKNINNRKPVYQNTKYYNAVIGTEHEGKSSMIAGKYIKDFLDD